MANYSLVIDSRFKPLSYDEIVKPLIQQTDLHNMYADAYSTLKEQADALYAKAEADLRENPDSKWAKKYNEYADNLSKSAAMLAMNGLTPTSRATVGAARSGYAKYVEPAAKAINRQRELLNIQLQTNPALRMEYQNMPSIDQLIDNPNIAPKGYSGSEIEKSAMTSAAAASARHVIEQFGKDRANTGWMRHLKETGYSQEAFQEMLAAAQDPNNIDANVLKGIMESVRNQFGYNNDTGLTQAQKNKLDAEILSGLFKGVAYRNENTYQQDPIYLENLRAANALKAQRERQAFEAREAEKNRSFQREMSGGNDSSGGYASFTAVPSLSSNDPKVREWDKAVRFITALRADPDMKHFMKGDLFGGYVMKNGVVTSGGSNPNANQAYWNQLVKKYGTKSPADILKKIDAERTKAVTMNQKYYPNVTSQEVIISNISNNVQTAGSNTGTGIKELNNGKIGKVVSASTFNSVVTPSNSMSYYDPTLKSWVVSAKTDKGTKEYLIAPEYINPQISRGGKRPAMYEYMDAIDKELRNGNSAQANAYVDEMIRMGVITPSLTQIQTIPKSSDKNPYWQIGGLQ